MQQLIGQSFELGQERYRVVDVRRMNGESMVYAEAQSPGQARSTGSAQPATAGLHPQRMAFHYSDIADLLDAVSNRTA